jgi:hypothetical protein
MNAPHAEKGKRQKPAYVALAAVIATAAVLAGALLYSRPGQLVPTSSTRLASVEDCTYIIISTTSINEGPVFRLVISTITSSYVTTASAGMTTGAVATTTTSPTYSTTTVPTPTVRFSSHSGIETVTVPQSPYIGGPYSVYCTYVR